LKEDYLVSRVDIIVCWYSFFL